jgi:hypothetical protein
MNETAIPFHAAAGHVPDRASYVRLGRTACAAWHTLKSGPSATAEEGDPSGPAEMKSGASGGIRTSPSEGTDLFFACIYQVAVKVRPT